jgi:hypothetical protein
MTRLGKKVKKIINDLAISLKSFKLKNKKLIFGREPVNEEYKNKRHELPALCHGRD